MGTLLARFLAGAAAGLIAWAVMEPSAPKNALDPETWGRWELQFMFAFTTIVGAVIGAYDGYVRGGKVHIIQGLLLGAVFGVVFGMGGYTIGGKIAEAMVGSGGFEDPHNILRMIPARVTFFAIMGLLLGAGIGASSLNLKKLIQGAIGGAIGAGIGGALFDIVGTIVGTAILAAQNQHYGEVGGPSRAIAFTLIGGSIALFIGLVERFTRSAWLRLNLGRNEGKEWSIDAAQTFIGRNERASVPLFGDPNVAPVHASIIRQGNQYILQDGGSPIGTLLNGQRIQQALLAHGSVIQIASFSLQFLMKGVAAPARGPEAYTGQAYPIGGYAPYPKGSAQPMPVPQVPAAVPMTPQNPSFAAPGAPTMAFQTPGAPTVAFQAQQPISVMSYGVVAMDGPLAGQRFSVPGTLEVGREASGIRLPDPNASRRHANLAPSNGGITVTDLGSTNGTMVNGQRVQRQEARVGDVIKIGGTNFRVEALA
jgi:pSer/pThr/pTyr-binding forkhead associated (FHA) protein